MNTKRFEQNRAGLAAVAVVGMIGLMTAQPVWAQQHAARQPGLLAGADTAERNLPPVKGSVDVKMPGVEASQSADRGIVYHVATRRTRLEQPLALDNRAAPQTRLSPGYAGPMRNSGLLAPDSLTELSGLPDLLGGDLGMDKVFGSDQRVRITPTNYFPASAQCRLVMTFPDGYTSAGSGSMIGSKYVLTAGHCVYSHDHGGWATSVSVFPGQDGSTKPWSAWATYLRSVEGWTSDENNDYDYALVTLNSHVGYNTGWFGLGSYSNATLDNIYGYIAGYPGDKAWGTQWQSNGRIEDYDSTMVYYDTDTNSGQSGSGVYRISGGNRYVFAVHGGVGWFWLEEYNRAARINNNRFDLIRGWMATGY